MADAIIFEVDCEPALYSKVNQALGLDPDTRSGEWPNGLLSHVGAGGDNLVIVFEVWESRAQQEAWMGKLGPALAEVGVPQPRRMEWFTVLGRYDA
jgi:hypothetical protein